MGKFYIPSGNQTWLAGKPPKEMKVYSWESRL